MLASIPTLISWIQYISWPILILVIVASTMIASAIIFYLSSLVLNRRNAAPIENFQSAQVEEPLDHNEQSEDERIIVDVTPVFLIGLYKEHAPVQADELAKSYLGKWMKIEGSFYDVQKCDGECLMVSFGRPLTITSDGGGVYAHFNIKWSDSLYVLSRGQTIIVLGRIWRIDPLCINLSECELMPL